VKDFSVTDCQQFAINLQWDGGPEDDSRLDAFPVMHQIPSAKILTFYRKSPFTIQAYYKEPSQLPFTESVIGTGVVRFSLALVFDLFFFLYDC